MSVLLRCSVDRPLEKSSSTPAIVPSGPEVSFWEVAARPSGLKNIVPSDFTPVLAKHSRFNLIDTLAGGVDRIQRNLNLVNEGSPQPPSSGHQARGLKTIQKLEQRCDFHRGVS